MKKKLAVILAVFVLLAGWLFFPERADAAGDKVINSVPLYCLYNSSQKMHTYTISNAERDALKNSGWTDQDIVTYISPVALPGTVPLHRCKFAGRATLLTLYPGDAVNNFGYTYEGVVGFVFPPEDTAQGQMPIYRYTHPVPSGCPLWNTDHYFTNTFAWINPDYVSVGAKFRAWNSACAIQKVNILAPAAGTNLNGGKTAVIKWNTSIAGGYIHLYYSLDGGTNWTLIKGNIINDSGEQTYNWTVPNISCSSVKIIARWTYQSSSYNSNAYSTSGDISITKIGSASIVPLMPVIPNLQLISPVPDAPTNLVAVPGDDDKEIKLYWQDNSDNEIGYKIERKTEGGTFTQITITDPDQTEYHDTSVMAGKKYYYQVKAAGSTGDSGYSNEAEGTYDLSSDPFELQLPEIDISSLFPSAPSNLEAAVLAGDQTGADLVWDASPGTIIGYAVERKIGSYWMKIGQVSKNETVFSDSGLEAGTYCYRVKSLNEMFESASSNEVSITLAGSSEAEPETQPETVSGTETGNGISGGGILVFCLGQTNYQANGRSITMEAGPINKYGRILLPIKYVTTPLGASIKWLPDEQKVVIEDRGKKIELWINKNNALVDGAPCFVDSQNPAVMPVIVNGRTMMPIRFIAENLGCEVVWDGETKKVTIFCEK